MSRKRGRELALDLIDEGILSPLMFAEAAIQWLTNDDVDEMLRLNDLIPSDMYDES